MDDPKTKRRTWRWVIVFVVFILFLVWLCTFTIWSRLTFVDLNSGDLRATTYFFKVQVSEDVRSTEFSRANSAVRVKTGRNWMPAKYEWWPSGAYYNLYYLRVLARLEFHSWRSAADRDSGLLKESTQALADEDPDLFIKLADEIQAKEDE